MLNRFFNIGKILLYLLLALLLAAAIFQVIHHVDRGTVNIWDEASSAQNAIEMLSNNNYIVVHHDGEPDHNDTRPPMAVWTKVISYKLFGINELSVRIPSIIAVILTMLFLLAFSLLFIRDLRYGIAILLLIACTAGYNVSHVARTGDPDALMVFFVSAYILAYFIILETIPKASNRYFIILGLAIGAAYYTKSVLGLAPLAGLSIYTFTQKNGYRLLKDIRFHLSWAATLIIILLYYVIREQFDPGYIYAVFIEEFKVINKPRWIKHPETAFYFNYLREIGFKPFFFFLFIPLVPMLFSNNNRIRRLLLYTLLGASAFLVGSSFVTIKNEWYIASIYPFLWLYLGVGFVELLKMILVIADNKFIQTTIFLAIIGFLMIFYFPTYKGILEKNTHFEGKYIYSMNREGHFLNLLKMDHPEYKELSVVTYENPRQVKFYAKKYHYLDSTMVYIDSTINDRLIGHKVIVCNDSLEKQLKEKYLYYILDTGRYCHLYEIVGKYIEE